MSQDVIAPSLGESVSEIIIGEWRKGVGDRVELDEPLVELESEKATIDLAAPVAGVIKSILKQQGDELTVTLPEEPVYVYADKTRLAQALCNLISNAATYGPEESTIAVDASRTGARLAIVVSDEGPGIPGEDLSRVFERFYRVDKSRARPGGTGLGLSIVKHLVHVLDGEVTASNRRGGGALFTVTLPLRPDDS